MPARVFGRPMKLHIGLLAAIALLAFLPATAAANGPLNPIAVNEAGPDASLASTARYLGGSDTCESENPKAGCTLRAAVELANEESKENTEVITIEVPAGTYTETLGSLTISPGAKIVITGAGATETIIDGGGKYSVFVDYEGGSLTVKGVTIQHGYNNFGGGGVLVDNEASLTVEASTLTENHADEDGGAIYGEGGEAGGGGATITVKDSTISGNTAGNQGGGIYLRGPYYGGTSGASLTVQSSTISENTSEGEGGGIYGAPGSSTSVERSTVAKNETAYDGGGIAAELGVENGCNRTAVGGLTIKQSTIEDNTAHEGDGGGVAVRRNFVGGCGAKPSTHSLAARPLTAVSETGNLAIEQSAITGNTANEEVWDGQSYGGEGGGIYEEGENDPIINSTIADNVAQRNGGGVAASYGGVAVLISDTVFGNKVEEPPVIRVQSKHAARAAGIAHHDTVGPVTEPGNNLSAEEDSALIELRNTIVAEPNSTTANCQGAIISLVPGAGYNLDYPTALLPEGPSDTCGMSTEDHDLVGVKPGLDEEGGLKSNGGPTQTIALLAGSPAIGVVPVASDCEDSSDGPAFVDQRGFPRPGIPGDGCDIGAYEYQAPPPSPPAPKTTAAAVITPAAVVTPKSGVLAFGAARLASNTSACVASSGYLASVSGKLIASVTFTLDGHRLKTLKHANSHGAFALRIGVKAGGDHHLTIKVTFTSASATKSATIKRALARCAAVHVTPTFTG